MKVRIQAVAIIVLSALVLILPGSTLAGGGSGSGGGTVITVVAGSAVAKVQPQVPQVAGTWRGSYSYLAFATGAAASPNNHEVIMFLNQSKDKLTGTFCLGAVSPGCFQIKGDVKAPNAVTIQFNAIATPFSLTGTVAPMHCLDGTAGQVMSGGFNVREGSGGFSFNNCP
jgi:hypothetical protein